MLYVMQELLSAFATDWGKPSWWSRVLTDIELNTMSLTIEFCRHPREADEEDGVEGHLLIQCLLWLAGSTLQKFPHFPWSLLAISEMGVEEYVLRMIQLS